MHRLTFDTISLVLLGGKRFVCSNMINQHEFDVNFQKHSYSKLRTPLDEKVCGRLIIKPCIAFLIRATDEGDGCDMDQPELELEFCSEFKFIITRLPNFIGTHLSSFHLITNNVYRIFL